MTRSLTFLALLLSITIVRSSVAHADPDVPPDPAGVELSFHYGLTQPILLKGFNAAIDVRRGR